MPNEPISKESFEGYKKYHRLEHEMMQQGIEQIRDATVNLSKAGVETMKVLEKINTRLDKQDAEDGAPLRFLTRVKEYGTVILFILFLAAWAWQAIHAPTVADVAKETAKALKEVTAH